MSRDKEDLIQGVTEPQVERLVVAFESLAASVADLARKHGQAARMAPQDVTITKVPAEEDILKEELFGEDHEEPIDRWLSLGPRERRFEAGEGAAIGEAPEAAQRAPGGIEDETGPNDDTGSGKTRTDETGPGSRGAGRRR